MNKDEYFREYIFSTTDPLNREVKMKKSTWNYHILDENERHELTGEENTIKEVISDPRFILPDKTRKTRENYIDTVSLSSSSKLKNLVITVDHEYQEYGDVVTAIAKSSLRQESTEGGVIYERRTDPSNE